MFDWLIDAVAGSLVGYVIVFAAAAGDVLLPIVPSETILITAGVIAHRGAMTIWLVIPAGALGAILGDNISYWLGRRYGERLAGRIFRGEKGRKRLDWARTAITRRGALLVVMGRFIPGGRTASTFAAGSLEMPYRRFLGADVAAGLIWATYAALLGYAGGSTFQHSTWKPLAVSLGLATLLGVAIEVWRRVQLRRGRDIFGDPQEG